MSALLERVLLVAALAALGLALHVEPARAEYRRPGLGGRWTNRHLTAPMNSLGVVLGPGQPALMSQRYYDQIVDGGGQYARVAPRGDVDGGGEDQSFIRAGVIFGLTEDWEAGALFLPFQISPEFAFRSIVAYGTRGFRMGDLDLGVRLSLKTPDSLDEIQAFWLNPGVPLVYRAGLVRLDTGVFMPFKFKDWWVSIDAPVRLTASLLPSLFFGVESGFNYARFDLPNASQVPLGALAGYTRVIGSNVVDFTASFNWNSFWLPDPPEGLDSLQTDSYRVMFGLVLHKLVK